MEFSRSLPHVSEHGFSGSVSVGSYCLSKWQPSQLKATFLPTLLQAAVVHGCRVIVLIEKTGDWPNSLAEHTESVNLTLNDVALDVVLESEARDSSGEVTMTWLRTVDRRTGEPLWAQGDRGGYECCMLRIAEWQLGTAPAVAAWRAFWVMYRRWPSIFS